jgi:hypothetical protein
MKRVGLLTLPGVDEACPVKTISQATCDEFKEPIVAKQK